MAPLRTAPHDPRLAFLYGGGEMGARLRAFDWGRTPLGDPAAWPPQLKTLVGLMLASEQPMFIAWGTEQVWLYNNAFIPIMGAKHPERLGCHALNEVWHEAHAVLAPLFARVFAGEPVQMDDFGLELDRRGRLEEAHFAFSYTPVRDDSGGVAGLFGACIETTQRVLAERSLRETELQLREADRRKDEFLATLAHELRNPLAPIANAVEVLNLQGSMQEVPRAARALIERQLNVMVHLVDDLLDASRIASGKLELRRARVQLAAVLEQALETARPLVQGHDFTVSLPLEPVWLDADPVRLAQVFCALINNACKYTPPGGRVRLDAERGADTVTVRIRDSGIGIPAEHMPRLFTMFSQASTARAHAHGGLGIGLALSRALVELHGGTIAAASDGAGLGAEFTVTLPALAQGAAPSAGRKAAVSPGSPRRILVADDNHDAATSLALLLRSQGHTVEVVNDGAHAVQAAGGFMPDVILLDIGLPGMDGYDVCRAIRSRPGGGDVVIAAITGWAQEGDRRKARDAGFDAHLVKPVDRDALFAFVAANATRRPLA